MHKGNIILKVLLVLVIMLIASGSTYVWVARMVSDQKDMPVKEIIQKSVVKQASQKDDVLSGEGMTPKEIIFELSGKNDDLLIEVDKHSDGGHIKADIKSRSTANKYIAFAVKENGQWKKIYEGPNCSLVKNKLMEYHFPENIINTCR